MKRLTPLFVLAIAACSREPSFEALQSAGYRELLQQGNLEIARSHAVEGRRRAREKHDSLWERRFQVLYAEVLVSQRRYREALDLLDAKAPPEALPHEVDVRAIMTRGLAQCQSSDSTESFRRAEADLEQAARMAAGVETAGLAGEVTLNRGNCALLRRDFPTAEKHFHGALGIARLERQAFLEARAAGSLGLLRAWTRRYDEATDWLNKALDLASVLRADLVVTKALQNLGWCYYLLGDYDRALGLLARAESLAAARGHTGDRLIALQNIGNNHFRIGELTRAAAYYDRALAIARDQADKRRMAELVSNLGIVALEQRRYDEAEGLVREALRIKAEIEDHRARQHSLLAEGQIWEGRRDYARAEGFYREVVGSPDSSRELLWETRASMAGLRIKTNQPAEAEAEFRKAFAIMEESRGGLRKTDHKISFFSSLGQFYDSYVDFLIGRGKTRQALEVADRSRARLLQEIGTNNQVPTVTAERFQGTARILDTVLLVYWLAPERSYLWVVTPRKVDLHVLPGEREIRKRVEAHQAQIQRFHDPLGEGAPEADWLYRNLVAPAGADIPPGARVVLVPDGPLHWINFETLVVPSPQRHYWIEDVTLGSAPSLAVLAARGSDLPRPAQGILIIGDAVPASDEFPRLAHAAKEIQRIGDHFSPSDRTVYSGAQADPSIYMTVDPRRFSLIHFATHAKANPEAPLDSAVILSAKDDVYKLYARDIVGIPLRAELVTLSACRSAGSRTFAGEGLVGLAWAFLSAGAGNVIAGLWDVADSSTSDLMNELYRGLRRGQRPAEALRSAKLHLLRSGTAHRKPFYWAPFMIYTQREPAARSSNRLLGG